VDQRAQETLAPVDITSMARLAIARKILFDIVHLHRGVRRDRSSSLMDVSVSLRSMSAAYGG
jgi:hypothetical protein